MNTHIARSVRFPLLSGKKSEFTKVFNSEVLPMLKTQPGFSNELMMVNDDTVVGVSVWNGKDALNKYVSTTYPKIEEKLRGFTSGKAQIETFELTAASTLTA
jgi:heme-degrading monooxygenase HmoA